MKIYLAGNGCMSKEQRFDMYIQQPLLQKRLLSYYECQPLRFCYSQWEWLRKNIL